MPLASTSSLISATDKGPQGQLVTALLRVSPLVLSSASLMFSWAQDISLGAFLHPSLRDDPAHPSGNVLPRYLPAFMGPGIWGIGLTFPSAAVLCIANGLGPLGGQGRGQSPGVRHLYLAGAAFSIAHFCWGPKMFAILARIRDPRTAGVPNEEALEEWLPNHRTRTLLVNVPAFLCILGATLGCCSL